MDNHKKEIIVTVGCSVCVAITAVIAALIAHTPKREYEVRIVPSYENVNTADYFPLKKGNSWTYIGKARSAVEGGDTIERKVCVEMCVVDEVAGAKATLFVMEGHPSDALWALKKNTVIQEVSPVEPSIYGFLVVANKIFRIPEKNLSAITAVLHKGGLMPDSLLSSSDMNFEFPLFRGQVYGSASQLARDDIKYKWLVNDSTLYHHPDSGRMRECPRYTLVYNTVPDFTEIGFIPYHGITSYSYRHHGTTAEVDVYLQKHTVHTEK